MVPPGSEVTARGGSTDNQCHLLKTKPISTATADEGHFIQDDSYDDDHDDDDNEAISPEPSGHGSIARPLDQVADGVEALGIDGTGLAGGSGTDAPATECMGSRARYYYSLPLRAIPEPRLKSPVRRITWKIRSHDQGWGGEGGDVYENSWTGFGGTASRARPEGVPEEQVEDLHDDEVRVESEDMIVEDQARWDNAAGEDGFPVAYGKTSIEHASSQQKIWSQGDCWYKDTQIQANRRANAQWKTHRVIWDYRDSIGEDDPMALERLNKQGRGLETGNGSQVRTLCGGDVVELWSYAFFPGWVNYVRQAECIIEFAL